MKKNRLKEICLILALAYINCYQSQVQQQVWYFKNNEINFRTSPPTVSPIASNFGINPTYIPNGSEGHTGLGIHNADGEKILTIFDYQVMNKYGDPIIGDLDNWEYGTSTPLFIPKPGSSCSYFIVYTTIQPVIETGGYCGSFFYYNTFYKEIDLSANGGLGGFVGSSIEIQTCLNKYISSPIAVSKELADGSRYLYTLDLGTTANKHMVVKKYVVSSNGINLENIVYSGIEDVTPVELELAHDGTKLALADNEGNKVIMLHLDNVTGNLSSPTAGNNGNGTSSYTIPSATNLTGVEFSENGNNLYVGSQDIGIFRINLPNNFVDPTPFLSSSAYGNSDLEMAYDPNGDYKIYAVHSNGSNLGSINSTNSTSPTFTANALSNVSVFENGFASINAANFGYKYLPKTIDGEDYISRFTNTSPECCKANSDYDVYDYVATQTNVTWLPTSNPFNNETVITVEHEIRIPAGKTITIKDMRFEFAPTAKVVVEKGIVNGVDGGKLILDNTHFTADTRCTDDMWKGVEVQGVATENQSLTATKQGIFQMRNNSRVAYAYVGAKAISGGIIQAANSEFANNHNSFQVTPYYPPSGANNLCRAFKCEFYWNDSLKNRYSMTIPSHVYVNSVFGVSFINNLFSNNITGINTFFYHRGMGISAAGSDFSVLPDWYNVSGTCPSNKKNIFRNFEVGINVLNVNGSPFTVDYAELYDCKTGINVYRSNNEKITRNKIAVRETDIPGMTGQKYGIVLQTSSGYVVEENTLTKFDDPSIPLTNVNTFGIVIRNSGEVHNEIYKNYFDNLKIGSQAEGTNAKLNVPLEDNYQRIGLQWKCNKFVNNIFQYDLMVTNGIVDYQQGYLSSSNIAGSLAANNQFSLDNEGGEHDFKLDQSLDLQYVYLNGIRLKPDAYTYVSGSGSSVMPIAQGNGTINYNGNFCPSSFSNRIPDPRGRRSQLGGIISDLTNKLLEGDNDALLEAIRTYNNLDELRPILIEKSPYLSDRMLNAIIDRNPNIDLLKDVLVANSSLHRPIVERVNQLALPNGTKQQIALAQKGINPREGLIGEISNYEREVSELTNQIIYDLQNVGLQENELIEELESSMRLTDKKQLLEIYVKNNNIAKINEVEQELLTLGVSQDYLQMVQIRKEINAYGNIYEAFNSITDLGSRLSEKTNSIDEEVKDEAQTLIDIINGLVVIKPFREVEPQRSSSSLEDTDNTKIQYISTLATIYPNPTSGQFYIDLPNEDEGDLKVEIFDISGKIVYQNKFEKTNGEQIELKDLIKGIYLVKITLDEKLVEVQKVELK